jgi:hypothetical protein
MKNYLLSFFFCIAILNSNVSTAQDVIKQIACKDEAMIHQADSVKKQLALQGFIVVKEAAVTMESEYEMPVIFPLTQGSWYQFVFIGDVSSKLFEVRMFDWNEKEVAYQKKLWGDVDGNIISFSYIPQFSEYHMMKPVQVNKKKKNICGIVMMLKKVK